MHGRGVDTDFEVVNAMQPDFLFISAAEMISIEMKVGAKSKIDQVLKYALLGLAAELRTGSTKTPDLGFLGVGNFSNQWREEFASPTELRYALNGADLRAFLQKQPVRFREHQGRFDSIVEQLHLGFINYERLAELLRGRSPSIDGPDLWRSGLIAVLFRDCSQKFQSAALNRMTPNSNVQ